MTFAKHGKSIDIGHLRSVPRASNIIGVTVTSILNNLLIMEAFSLEENGYFQPDTQEISSDPFSVLDKPLPPKPTVRVEEYSNISDDDFMIPCSQNRLPPK